MLPGRSSTAIRKHYTNTLRPKPPPAKRPEDAREDSGRQSSPAPFAGGARAATPPSGLKRAPADAPIAGSRLPSAERSADSRAAGRSSSAAPDKKAASGSGSGAKGRKRSTVEVDARCTNRSGGDARVRLQQPVKQPPPGNTVQEAHKLSTLQGVCFYQAVTVQDPDDSQKEYRFDLADPVHGACFNIGIGPDGSPLISWSNLHALYELPDGTKWAEHGFFHDAEDMEDLARKKGRPFARLEAKDTGEQELFRKAGRYHSRLQNIEYECWVFEGALPSQEELAGRDVELTDAYFWRSTFDPETLEIL
ncbi:g95 [Coccomyxa elongata]